ncbi:WYL domain-containing protein [Corynebacterium sp. H127]|uniref:helix-turn-helix transcriptional regulator n=1 Tax=Corynebacterium sp. H127 TaxID=3133418 RepID=UPI0030A7E102
MTEKDPGLERLTNLTFAFLNASTLGRQFLTAAWVRRNVAGYQNRSDEAFDKAFRRDRLTLTKVGVPIEAIADAAIENGVRVTGYRLQTDDYSLPEVTFTPEEATVLGLAGERGTGGELGVFARSGWTKLAAAGASRDLAGGANFATLGDLSTLSAQTLDLIVRSCNKGARLSFSYRPHASAPMEQRSMDPWGLVPLRGRMYLVGHDVGRDAVRSFRITKITEIGASGTAEHPKPTDANLQDIVEESLRRGRELVSARVRVTPGKGTELAEQGDVCGDVVELVDVDRRWLLRACLAHAPHAVVLEPADVRQELISALEAM